MWMGNLCKELKDEEPLEQTVWVIWYNHLGDLAHQEWIARKARGQASTCHIMIQK